MFSVSNLTGGRKASRGAGYLSILAIGVLACFSQPALGQQPAVNLNYLPDNAQFVANLKLAEIMASPVYAAVAQQDPNVAMQMQKLKTEAGVDVKDVTHMTVAGKVPMGGVAVPDIVGLMQTRVGYTTQQILTNMGKTATPVAVGNFTIQEIKADNAFCVVAPTQILFGPTASLQAILQRNGQAVIPAKLLDTIKGTNFNSAVALVADVKALKNAIPAGAIPGGGLPGGAPGGNPFGNLNVELPEAASLEMTFGQTMVFKGFAMFAKAKDATDIAQLAQGLLALANLQGNLEKEVKDLLDSVKISAQGNKLTAQMSMSTAALLKAMKQGKANPFGGPKPPAPANQERSAPPTGPAAPPVAAPPVPPVPAPPAPPVFAPPGPPKPALPPVAVQPAAQTFNENGSFSKSLTINPNQSFTFNVTCQANQPATFTVKPQIDAKLDIKVYQNGVLVAQDLNGPIKTNFALNWNSTAANCQVQVVSTDNIVNTCTFSFNQGAGGGVVPPAPAGVIQKPGPFTEVLTIKPNDNFTYQFPVQNGPATFTIKPQQDAILNVKVFQNGVQVAQDLNGGVKTNFVLNWNAQAGANVQVQIQSTDNLTNQCTLSFAQAGGGVVPPAPAGVINKTGPFSEVQNIKPNDQFTYSFPVQAGQAAVTIKPQFDAKLDVQVIQNGAVVAQDVNGPVKTNFNLTWNAQAGNATLSIKSTDNIVNNCTISFAAQAGGGVGVAPGVIQKNGPFTDNVTIKPNDKFTYQFPVNAGQATFNIKPQFDAILTVQVMQNGVVVAQDNGLKTVFNLSWNAQAGNATVNITSTDNLTNNCTLSFNQGPGGVVPPPAGGGAPSVNGNCPMGGTTTHSTDLKAGTQYTITLNTLTNGYDPYLWLYDPNGQLVAQDDDGGGFPNAKIVYTPTVNGKFQLKCGSFGMASGGMYQLAINNGALIGAAGGGVAPPPAGGVIQKNGPFTEQQNIAVGAQFTYQFPAQNGQYTLTIKPQFDAKLDVQVFQNNVQVVQDVNGPIKTNFSLNWNGQAGATVQVKIKSTDNIANQCTITVAQGGGINPPPPPPGNVINKPGPFSEVQNIAVGAQFTYAFPVQAGQATFTIKPQFDAKLDIQVIQNGAVVAQDTNGPIKNNFNLTWNAQAGNATVTIKSTDNIANQCTISFAQAGGIAPPPPPPGGAIQKNGPFSEGQNIKPNDQLTYQFPVQNGQATFTIKPQFDAKLDVQIFQNGVQVAQDVNGPIKTVFNFTWNGQAGAQVQVKIKSTDNIANQCTMTFAQGGGGVVPPPPGNVINKPGPFTEQQNIAVGAQLTYAFPVQAGQATFTIKPQFDAKLDVQVIQNGVVVAQDTNGPIKTNFNLTWNAQAGNATVTIKSTDNIANQCTMTFAQGGGLPPPPPPPGGKAPVGEMVNIKPNDQLSYQFPVQAGQATFTIKPQFDAKLDVQIFQNGVVVAQDVNGPIKTVFNFTWNGQAGAQVQVKIKSTDNIANNCTLTFSQGGGFPPPPPGGGAPSVNGNCPMAGTTTHTTDLKAGTPYTITLNTLTNGYDPYLWLYDPNGQLVAQDDDSGGFPNSKIVYTPTVNGKFQLKVGSFANASGGQYQLAINNGALIGGAGAAPPPPVPVPGKAPAGETVNIKPNDQLNYQFPVQAGQATFTIKPQFDAKLDIQIIQNGVTVAQDVNGPIKTNFSLTWNAQAGNVSVSIKSTDNIANNCTITFTQGGALPPPKSEVLLDEPITEDVAASLLQGGTINKPGPFSEVQSIKPNDKFTYQVKVGAGASTLKIKPEFDAILNVKVLQNGVELAKDLNGGVKKEFLLNFNLAAGEATIEIVSTDNLTNKCTITFSQGNDPPPPPPGGGTPSVKGNCPVNGTTMHTTELKAGTAYTITLNTLTNGYDPYLWLYDPTGQLVAQDDDGGGFPNAKIVYTPTVNGKFQLKCGSFGMASGGMYELAINNGALIGGGPVPPPPPGGIIKKPGPFTDNLNIKPNDKYTYQITVAAGAATLTIKPQFDAILNVKVTQNNVVLAQDMNGGVKKNFSLPFNAAAGEVTVEIVSPDTLTNMCTVTFAQGGVAPPPPPVGGAASVKGNCPNGGTTMHTTELKAGTAYTITLNTLTNGYDPYLYLYDPTGNLVAQDDDGGGFPNAKIVYTPTVNGKFQLKCGSFQNASGGQYELAINNGALIAGAAAPPAPGGVIKKNGAFTDQLNIKPNDKYTYQVTAAAGQSTLTIKPQFDAILNVKVTQNNVVLAQDMNGGVKQNFVLNFNAAAGDVTVEINSADTLTNNCTVTFSQAGGKEKEKN